MYHDTKMALVLTAGSQLAENNDECGIMWENLLQNIKLVKFETVERV